MANFTEYEPAFLPGDSLACVAAATVSAGQLVAIGGTTGALQVAPTTAATSSRCGVAGFNAIAGAGVTVYFRGVHPVTAATAVAPGAAVTAGPVGEIMAYPSDGGDPTTIIGHAIEPAEANSRVRVMLR